MLTRQTIHYYPNAGLFCSKPLFKLPFGALWLNIIELILAKPSQKKKRENLLGWHEVDWVNRKNEPTKAQGRQYPGWLRVPTEQELTDSLCKRSKQQYHRLVLTVLKGSLLGSLCSKFKLRAKFLSKSLLEQCIHLWTCTGCSSLWVPSKTGLGSPLMEKLRCCYQNIKRRILGNWEQQMFTAPTYFNLL